ncbi:MAG: hypothetical protein CMO81_05840 [Waddliaceae bacterium]|nr:hypothetical protein [Waddliaceae bacterium]
MRIPGSNCEFFLPFTKTLTPAERLLTYTTGLAAGTLSLLYNNNTTITSELSIHSLVHWAAMQAMIAIVPAILVQQGTAIGVNLINERSRAYSIAKQNNLVLTVATDTIFQDGKPTTI